MTIEYSLREFEEQIGYLRRLNASSIEKTNSLFDDWFHFIVKYPIECIDIVCETSNTRLIKNLLTKFVNRLSNEDAETNRQQNQRSILFVAACYINDLIFVEKCLANNEIDVNFNKFNHLLPALHIACDQENIKLVKLLLDSKKLNVNLLSKAQPNNSALHKLCETSVTTSSTREDILKLLIKSNIDINISNQYNETPLHVCVYYENYNMAKLLIDNHANTNKRASKSLNSRTCLHYCANQDSDNINLFKLLFNHQSTNYMLNDSSDENVFQIANTKGNINICKYIVESNRFPLNSNNELIRNIICSSIELNHIQSLKYYFKKFQIKLDVDKFLKCASVSKNFNEILSICLQNNSINMLDSSKSGTKILEYISNEHLKDLRNIMIEESMKHNWYLNSRKLFQINNLYLQNLINLFKNVFVFDYDSFERTIISHLFLHDLLTFDLDFFDSKFDRNRPGKPVILFNDEILMEKFLKFIILSGRLKQYEIANFIRMLLENVFYKLEHKYSDLLRYLDYQSKELLTLKQLCRIKIRSHLIHQHDDVLECIEYPNPLKRYLNFYEIFY